MLKEESNEILEFKNLKIRELFEYASDAIFLYEVYSDCTPSKFIKVSRVAYEQLGYTQEEMLTMTPIDIQKDTRLDQTKNYIQNMMTNGPILMENLHVTKSGQEIPCELSARIFQFGKKKIALTIVRYIAERKKVEEKLIRSEKLAVVGELAAGVAHEIRNPLTSIKGLLQLLQEDEKNELYTSIILSEVERINKIVSDFLVLAKPHEYEVRQLDIHRLIMDVIELMRPQSTMANVLMQYHFHDTLQQIRGNEDQLKQVLLNVLNNAIESMPTGGNIWIETKTNDQKEFRIAIHDHGVGIPLERIDKLGEPFYTTKEKGTGLGLTVSKRIIDAHHGKILYSSEIGFGTTVEIFLPIALT